MAAVVVKQRALDEIIQQIRETIQKIILGTTETTPKPNPIRRPKLPLS
jgi:hypothetical protein